MSSMADSTNREGDGSGESGPERRDASSPLTCDAPKVDAAVALPEATPLVCLVRFASDAASGGVMGSIFGYGSGLFNKKGLKGSFSEVGPSAKTFAIDMNAMGATSSVNKSGFPIHLQQEAGDINRGKQLQNVEMEKSCEEINDTRKSKREKRRSLWLKDYE